MNGQEQRDVALVGTVLGDAYRLTRLIGRGGMGAVYEAQQLRLDRKVAVKLMAPHLALDEEALARFHREVRVTARLCHPHIVQVSDFGRTPDGAPYLVMEHLEGEDLEQRLRRVKRLPLADAVHIARQTAAALGATHRKGIVHRDLKPANVFLLSPDGDGGADFVKVVDFGISKARDTSAKLTRTQVMLGTPDYMAPEQAAGRPDDVDHRTDQWALACIVWEMLSGRPPFAAESLPLLLYQIVQHQPPPLGVPGVPAEVEQVLRRALSKRAGERFSSIAGFARALGEATVPRPAALEVRGSSTLSLGSVTRSLEVLAAAPAGLWGRVREGVAAVGRQRRRRKALTRPLHTVARFATAFGGARLGQLLGKRKTGRARLAWLSAGAAAALLIAAALYLRPWAGLPAGSAPQAAHAPGPAPAHVEAPPPAPQPPARTHRTKTAALTAARPPSK